MLGLLISSLTREPVVEDEVMEMAEPVRREGGDHSLAALKPIHVILDNLPANKTPVIRSWAARNKVELCFWPSDAALRLLGRPAGRDH